MRAQIFAALAVLAFGASCLDPVHDDAIAGLKDDGLSNGPEHRAGQPCLTCHGGRGPASAKFAVAGTVYTTSAATDPAPGVTVTVIDADRTTKRAVTNSVGNFYIVSSDFSPVYPLHVGLTNADGTQQQMISRIGGDGSCATCHVGSGQNAGDRGHVPQVFMSSK
jgi:hypothetical protein